MSFKPGPGMGGHCLPVDPFYLAWRAREFDMQTEFIELAGEVNQKMPYFCVERVARALNDHSKSVRGSRVGIFGVSYKPGVGDLRESPALRIIRLLRAQGAEIVYHDDFVPELPEHGLRSEWPQDVDCAVIVTAHPGLDVERIVREAPLVVDFRGVTRWIEAPNLVRLLRRSESSASATGVRIWPATSTGSPARSSRGCATAPMRRSSGGVRRFRRRGRPPSSTTC